MQVFFCQWLDINAIDCDCRKVVLIAFAAYWNLTYIKASAMLISVNAVLVYCPHVLPLWLAKGPWRDAVTFPGIILSPCQWVCLLCYWCHVSSTRCQCLGFATMVVIACFMPSVKSRILYLCVYIYICTVYIYIYMWEDNYAPWIGPLQVPIKGSLGDGGHMGLVETFCLPKLDGLVLNSSIFAGWYAIFEPEPCLSPNQISASILISISISASTSISIYLLLVASIYICLLLFTSISLSLPIYIYIYRSIYTSLCVQYLINIYICILMYNTSIDRLIHRSFYISKHIHTYRKHNKCTICNRTYVHRRYIDSGGPGHSATFTIWRSTWSTWSPVAPWSMPWGLEVPWDLRYKICILSIIKTYSIV